VRTLFGAHVQFEGSHTPRQFFKAPLSQSAITQTVPRFRTPAAGSGVASRPLEKDICSLWDISDSSPSRAVVFGSDYRGLAHDVDPGASVLAWSSFALTFRPPDFGEAYLGQRRLT